ncbi:MAG: hypothetical protein K2Y71_07085 [Xanthobacteraceae bacterium]|nr:hypothetical protein [Xanthobacteraceae bacterium]
MGFAMDRQQPASPLTTFLCGLAAIGMGLFLLLFGLGVVPMKPRAGDGPLWIAAVAGIVFMLAGVSITVGALHGVSDTGELPKDTGWWMRLFYYLLGVVISGGLASIGTWVAFGAGPRVFSGTGVFLLSLEANAMVGRIMFGIGAMITWLFTIAIAISGARKLISGKSS